jgi:hypothetical protein
MERILTDPAGYLRGRAGATAALVLYRAKQVGHPDLAALRDKVLATRDTPSTGRLAEANGPDVADALALALTDPDTARTLLARRLSPKDPAVASLGHREPLIALALADPAALTPVVDRLVAEAVKRRAGYQSTGLATLVRILTEPDRLLENVGRYSGLTVEYEDD